MAETYILKQDPEAQYLYKVEMLYWHMAVDHGILMGSEAATPLEFPNVK